MFIVESILNSHLTGFLFCLFFGQDHHVRLVFERAISSKDQSFSFFLGAGPVDSMSCTFIFFLGFLADFPITPSFNNASVNVVSQSYHGLILCLTIC